MDKMNPLNFPEYYYSRIDRAIRSLRA
ncbi:uncharacterized protein METZ01_LOCUS141590, partial [marine metagenome]